MDKNTIIGFVIIAAILIGFSVMNRPSEEELAREQRYNDSIALVQQQKAASEIAQKKQATAIAKDSLNSTDSTSVSTDAFGAVSASATGKE